MLGYARGLAELSQAAIRGGKRAVDAIAAGMSQETPGFRALAEAAARGRISPKGGRPSRPNGRRNSRSVGRPRRCPTASARLCRRHRRPRRVAHGAGPHPFAGSRLQDARIGTCRMT